MNQIKLSMQRIYVITMLSVYLIFSIGIIKATHFCMGRAAYVSLFSSESQKCVCSLFTGEKDSCCDDQHELIRLENEQKVVSVSPLPFLSGLCLSDYTLNNLLQKIFWRTLSPTASLKILFLLKFHFGNFIAAVFFMMIN